MIRDICSVDGRGVFAAALEKGFIIFKYDAGVKGIQTSGYIYMKESPINCLT